MGHYNYGGRKVRSFLVNPEVVDTTPVILVIHENCGLNDWARSMADLKAAITYAKYLQEMERLQSLVFAGVVASLFV